MKIMLKEIAPFALILFTFCHPVQSQILKTFETEGVEMFGVEGDGSASRAATGGLPGACLRMDDYVLGLGSILILSPEFYGSWALATPTDSLIFDFKPVNISGGATISPNPFLAEIYGPGGIARCSVSYVTPPFNIWQNKRIALNPSNWTMVSGTWSGLMQNVNKIRIMSEYVNGDEYVLFDNIGLSFTPEALSTTPCSDFVTGSGFDGWNVDFVNSFTATTFDGNPPNCLVMSERAGTATLLAPPKFKGSWAEFQDNYQLRVDLKVVKTQPTLTLPPYFIRLTGKYGTARIPATSAIADSCVNRWFTFQFPINSETWTQVSGTWDSTLLQVTQLAIIPEFWGGNGTENIYLDNICLEGLVSNTKMEKGEADLVISPNPTDNFLNFSTTIDQYLIFDHIGRLVKSGEAHLSQIEVKYLPSGIYHLKTYSKSVLKNQRFIRK